MKVRATYGLRVLARMGCALVLLGSRVDRAPAQVTGPIAPASLAHTTIPQDSVAQPSVRALAGKGAVGGVAGALLGGLGGYLLAHTGNSCDDECGLWGATLGAMTGETIGISVGVHRGNQRRGSFGLSLLAAVGSGLAGAIIVDRIGSPVALVGIPILQLYTTILVQRRTTRPGAT